ncbi:FlxA-like family protein [Pseudomonas viridiflava]|uniref:FlxA-like family protein n=1 Tax=Pseudomonas syringae group TaxID=136849 RepID=UPI000F070958|nr:hypothetical protein [Pseudomonas viridiflava]QXG34069.1 hypothetical protein KTT61_18535 [Pseudomonas viridiflava]QXG42290.1 hypothetical protein KTT55_07280 [Pseudomonas viridiflava]
MTTINTSTLTTYSSSFTLAVKSQDTQAGAASTDGEGKSKGISVDLSTASPTASGGSAGGSSKSALEQTLEKLKEQIKQVQKQLAEQQSQLAAAQSGKGTPEEKAQRAMAIQTQIGATTATLQTLQGALLQLQTEGGVNTTA